MSTPWVAVCGCGSPSLIWSVGAHESPVLLGLDEPRVDSEDCGALVVDNAATSTSRLGQEDALQPVVEDLEELRCDEDVVQRSTSTPSTVVTVSAMWPK